MALARTRMPRFTCVPVGVMTVPSLDAEHTQKYVHSHEHPHKH